MSAQLPFPIFTGSRGTVSIFAATVAALLSGAAIAAEWHVSPSGNDAWSGSLAEPNAGLTDGPVATLERARDAIRERRKAGRDVRTCDPSRFIDEMGMDGIRRSDRKSAEPVTREDAKARIANLRAMLGKPGGAG